MGEAGEKKRGRLGAEGELWGELKFNRQPGRNAKENAMSAAEK